MNYIVNGHQYVISHATLTLILLLAIWELIWKGFALWRAGKNSNLGWFIVILILNTAGILEILYLFVFSKPNDKK
ncbi:MAG: DUF5652 family protein [Candidatus Saccharimonadales bacterium]|jgi:hypothetical protein